MEEVLRATVQRGTRRFTEAAAYLVAAGGKRLRPLLTLASGHAGRHIDTAPANDRMITAAAAVELLHLGTLYHDDVIDEAETRRGWPSVNARWGNTVAVLAGDMLLASAWEAASSLGGEEAHLLSRTLATMCRGEALETQRLFDVERDESAFEEASRARRPACWPPRVASGRSWPSWIVRSWTASPASVTTWEWHSRSSTTSWT